MKQKQCLWIMVIALLLLTGCVQQQQQMSYIGAEKAKQVALEDCGLSVPEIEAMTVQFASPEWLGLLPSCIYSRGAELSIRY